MRCAAVATALATAALAGCGGARASAPAAPAATASSLLEDFEDDRLWTADAADDHARLRADRAHATHGALALAIAVEDDHRGKAVVRKEVDDDFTHVERVRLDARLVAGKAEVALALRTANGAIYEFAHRPVAADGEPLAWEVGAKQLTSGDGAAWQRDRAQVNRLLLHVYPSGGDAEIAVDALRGEPGGAVARHPTPRLAHVDAAPTRVGLRRTFAVAFAVERPLPATLADAPFAGTLDARLRLRAPDGHVVEVRGFATAVAPGDGVTTWSYTARFTPADAGEWRWQIVVGDGVAATAGEVGAFICDDADRGRAFVHVDRGDPRWLADDDGAWFYPIGMNVAWAGDYEPYFAALAEAGANTARVWLCPWNHPLEAKARFSPPDFAHAAAVDAMLDAAERHGLRVVLAVQFHGALTWDWARSPWNAANGGPCKAPREFWTRGDARDLMRRYLDYAVARWAHAPALLAWELMNEADLCPAWSPDDIVDWHRDLAGHLKRIDPYGHLVTASVASPDALPALWRLTDIDVAQPHRYGGDAPEALAAIAGLAGGAKPVLVGETARGWEPRDDQPDADGRQLRASLWLGWLSDACGAPLPWWWDTHIAPNRLTRLFAPLARFSAGEDRRGRRFARVAALRERYVVEAAVAPDVVYAYLRDPRDAAQPGVAPLAPVVGEQDALEFSPVLPGRWRIEWWDVADPDAAPMTETIDVGVDATLRVAPGVRLRDVALKARRDDAAPRVRALPE